MVTERLLGGTVPQASALAAVDEDEAGEDATRQGLTLQPLEEWAFLSD